MSLTLFLLRHGQTEFSRANAFCGSGLDPELTSDGIEMARSFAAAYQGMEWSGVYTSPLRRAIATAEPLCRAVGIPATVRDDLKEIGYGRWEGCDVETVSRDFHDDYIRWSADPAWYPPTGGEPAVAIAQRAVRAVEEIRSRTTSGNVLIVSHKATLRILLCELLGVDVGRFRYRMACPVASVSVVQFGRHGPLLVSLADRSHLSADLRNLPGT